MSNASPQERRSRRRRAVAIVLGLTTVALGASLFTGALYSETVEVPGNHFAVGTIDLTVSPASTVFNVPSMMPGDSFYETVTVGNSGTEPLRYAMTKGDNWTGDLNSVLTIATSTNTTCDAAGWPSGEWVSTEQPFGDTDAIFGDTAQGDQAGDRVLAGGDSETLCFKVSLPASVEGDHAGEELNSTFSFVAEQVANNP